MKRIIPIISVILLLFPFSLNVVLGATISSYNKPLPANTIYFDDFEDTAFRWFTNDACASCITGINSTIGKAIYDGNQALYIKEVGGAAQTQDARFTFHHQSDIVGFAFWFDFSCNARASPAPAFGFSLEYWDSNQHRREAKIQYTPTTGNQLWAYGHDNFLTDNIVLTQGAITYTPSYVGYNDFGSNCANTRASNSYLPVKIVANRATNQYVSITTPETTWTCNNGLNNGCTIKDDGSDIIFGANKKNTAWGLEFQVDGTSGTPTVSAYFDNILVTDETPGNPNIVQFAVNSAGIILLMFIGIIGILYYLRIGDRLMFGKGKGLFGSRPVIKYREPATTAEQEAKRAVKVIVIILILGAIVATFGLYFAGFI